MNISKNWFLDEFKQIGKDYADQSEVDVYESSHAQFRDIYQESIDLLKTLNPSQEDKLIDFGCGTGIFAIESAKVCNKVYAVDISTEMLHYAQKKATQIDIHNIEFCHSGFLNFEIEDNSVNYITTTFSFHHLPDYWKGIALNRMYNMLKPRGILYIKDVVISEKNSLVNIQNFIDAQTEMGGDFLKEDAEIHFKEEFSTYDWILEGLVSRSGFKITSKKVELGLIAAYICIKE
ncbi:methyltransferase domain-containing protein [Muricauda ruestringensis]|uniref:Methyltransferase domain-containing protein n=1 Tax=Flagellimonas aurea TaxID=2915619 RepID=A0ABS3G9G1_9FLAO|nr:class I SAM-dependent methyltransferase [Allomuricauda aurea]MBO0356054.1 methyltransferase domain-containing protein [Allomuricauda aurea]